MVTKKENYVIVRADRAGVFFGILKEQDNVNKTVVLDKSQCIYYWDGAARISQLAVEGTKAPENCKFTVPVNGHQIAGWIEILPCTTRAVRSIKGVKPWVR